MIEKNNYISALNYAKKQFKSLNPNIISQLSNIQFNRESSLFEINLLNNQFNVEYPSGNILEDSINIYKNLELSIILIRYLINSKGVPLTNKFITFKELPGGNVYYNNFLNRTIKRLAYEFIDCIDKYILVMENLKSEKLNIGDLAYKFNFLGNTSMIFVIWFKDEEFEANANILFDSNIIYYFDTEDLAVVPDIAIDFISNMIKEDF